MDMTEQIKNDLYSLNLRRMSHIEGVLESALELRSRHFPDISENKVVQAAYLHDFTKEYDSDRHIEICERYGLELDVCESSTEKLLHAKSGYAVAKYVYRLDEDICSAVLYHTTGRAAMTPLEKIIYIADYIEKNRKSKDCVKVREKYIKYLGISETPLEHTLLYALNKSIKSLISDNELIHENTIHARNYLIKEGIKCQKKQL